MLDFPLFKELKKVKMKIYSHQVATELRYDWEKHCNYRVTVLYMHMLVWLLITLLIFFTSVKRLPERWRAFYSPPPQAIDNLRDRVLTRKKRKGNLGLDALRMRRVLKFGIYIVYKSLIPCLVMTDKLHKRIVCFRFLVFQRRTVP